MFCLGIFNTLSARLEDKTDHLRFGSVQPKGPSGWVGEEWRQNDTTHRISAPLSFMDHVGCTRLFSQWFGVTVGRVAHQGMKIGLFFGNSFRAVDEAITIVIDRFGSITQNCPDSGCRGKP